MGGRRRRSKKTLRTRRQRRFRGGEFPSLSAVETHPNGHLDVRSGYTVSTPNAVASSYEPVSGGRRRTRRSRHRRSRHRMRGGTGGIGSSYGFGGAVSGTPWPIADRTPGYTTSHEANAAGYNGAL